MQLVQFNFVYLPMLYFIIYFIGCLTVWVFDKRMTYENGWYAVAQRFAVSLFSWFTLVIFLAIQASFYIGRKLEKSNIQPPTWL